MLARRWLAALAALFVCVGLAYVAQQAAPAGAKMTTAAQEFLAKLSPEQKAKATFSFDDPERTNWDFVPLQTPDRKPTRKGLPLEEMTGDQRQAALALLRACTSDDGYLRATTIMSLEALLRELEKNGGLVRNPDWYFFTVFGAPDPKGKWGLRVEGHHLSLNFVVDRGQVLAATPTFLGANPALVKDGDKKGTRVLGEIEELGQGLFKSLKAEQRRQALQEKQFDEVKARNKRPQVGDPVGVPATALNEGQKETLGKLIRAYLKTLPTDVAAAEQASLKPAGLDRVFFAYAGGTEPGQPYTFRLQGPTFLAEFLNVQADSARNPANHVHTCWRSLDNDFGLRMN